VVRIGRPDRPVRALAFAGGGFDTAIQLGVTHALLVMNGRPPDIVIGSSVGAVNAVALAEVFQAGLEAEARVARFREIFEEYQAAPGRIADAVRPDTFQVDSRRPLKPLELPIHDENERQDRESELAARAGMINLYIALLNLHVSVGTLVRGVRRWLGVQQAGAIRGPVVRVIVRAGELFRSWGLLGVNLLGAVPLWWPLLLAARRRRFESARGATAADLIFRSRVWAATTGILKAGSAFLFLVSGWTMISAILLAFLVALGAAPVGALTLIITRGGPAEWTSPWAIGSSLVVGGVVAAIVFARTVPPERSRLFLRSLWALVLFALLSLFWAIVLVTILLAPLLPTGLSAFVHVPPGPPWYWPAMLGVLAVGVLIACVQLARHRSRLGVGLLGRFRLDASLFDRHTIRRFFVELFDPEYYGTPDFDDAVERALDEDHQPATRRPHQEKLLEDYADPAKGTPIHVAVTVADLASGEFRVLPSTYKVVDGLLAAVAAAPLFPPTPYCREDEENGSSRGNSLSTARRWRTSRRAPCSRSCGTHGS
jgi:predicted acylesterase/phospholipase RssA